MFYELFLASAAPLAPSGEHPLTVCHVKVNPLGSRDASLQTFSLDFIVTIS